MSKYRDIDHFLPSRSAVESDRNARFQVSVIGELKKLTKIYSNVSTLDDFVKVANFPIKLVAEKLTFEENWLKSIMTKPVRTKLVKAYLEQMPKFCRYGNQPFGLITSIVGFARFAILHNLVSDESPGCVMFRLTPIDLAGIFSGKYGCLLAIEPLQNFIVRLGNKSDW